MEKYTKVSLKITLIFFLSATGLAFLTRSSSGFPPGYDFGKETHVWHIHWIWLQWEVIAKMGVQYDDNGQYILAYTDAGSCALVHNQDYWHWWGMVVILAPKLMEAIFIG